MARSPRFAVFIRSGAFIQATTPTPRRKNVSHRSCIKVITQNHQTIFTRIGALSMQVIEIFSIARRLGPSLVYYDTLMPKQIKKNIFLIFHVNFEILSQRRWGKGQLGDSKFLPRLFDIISKNFFQLFVTIYVLNRNEKIFLINYWKLFAFCVILLFLCNFTPYNCVNSFV